MKWSVSELKKKVYSDNKIDFILDFKNRVNPDIDILDIEPVSVSGSFSVLNNGEMFVFVVRISTELTMPCSITLKETKVLIDFPTMIVYTFKVVDDDSYQITGQTIEIDDAIWANIVAEKPMKVVSEGAYFEDEIIEIEDDNPFLALQNKKQED